MKKPLALLYIIIAAFSAKADYWTQKASFGGVSRMGAVGFSIGNKGYLGTGLDSTYSYLNDFWEYNQLTNVWTQKADCGGIGRYAAVGFSIGNKGYIGCGLLSGSYANDLWEYDAVANTWTQKADLGGVGRIGSVGFSINNKGYIGTGYDSTQFNLKDFWEYDPSVNAWVQKMDVGGIERFGAVGFSDGAKGYLGTGSDDIVWPGGKKDFWEWDPNTNVWTQKADVGGAVRSEACAFSICPYGYIGIGTTTIGSGTVSDFWRYNFLNNTWTQATNFGAGLREMPAAFSIGNKGYVGTGWINDSSPHTDFWEYTPDSACATGIDEFQISNFDFQISPNPAKEFLVCSFGFPVEKKIEITVTDVTGKKVFETYLRTPTLNFKLQTLNFPNGIYFIEVSNGKQKAVKKFLKE